MGGKRPRSRTVHWILLSAVVALIGLWVLDAALPGLLRDEPPVKVSDALAEELTEFQDLAAEVGAEIAGAPRLSELELTCGTGSDAPYPGAVVSFEIEHTLDAREQFEEGLRQAGYSEIEANRVTSEGRTAEQFWRVGDLTIVWLTIDEENDHRDVTLNAQPLEPPC